MHSEIAAVPRIEIQKASPPQSDEVLEHHFYRLFLLKMKVHLCLERYSGSSSSGRSRPSVLPMSNGQQDQVFNARSICAAITKRGRPCCRPAGTGTDHPGRGPCYLHGGGPLVVKIGRYSTVEDEELRTRIAEFSADPNLLDLSEDVALLRAFLVDLIDNWSSIFGPDGCLTVWLQSFKSGKELPRPMPKFPDFASVSALVGRVGDIVEKIRRQQARTAIPIDEHDIAMSTFVSSVTVVLEQVNVDKEIAAKIVQLLEEHYRHLEEEADEAGPRETETNQFRGTTLPAVRKLPH